MPPPNQPGLSDSSVREIMAFVWIFISLLLVLIVVGVAYANPGVRLTVMAAFYRWRAARSGARRVPTYSSSASPAARATRPLTPRRETESAGGAITFGRGASKPLAKPGRARPGGKTYAKSKSSEEEQEPLQHATDGPPPQKSKAPPTKSKRGIAT